MRPLALALLLSGCAIIKPDYYQTMSTAQICHGLMVYPAWNVNHPARWRELERRGASCGSPADIAASQQQAGANAAAVAVPLLTAPQPVIRPAVTCHTSGAVTTCR